MRLPFSSTTLLAVVFGPLSLIRADPPAEFFEKEVRPLLVEHCQGCHGEKKHKGGLTLTSRASLMSGGESGTAVVLGKPKLSLLVRAVRYGDEA